LFFQTCQEDFFSFSNFFGRFFAENSFMENGFWDNIRKLLSKQDKPDVWLIKEAKLGKTAIINGQKRHTTPSADKAYRCAKALSVTVEELVDGESGAEYVRQIVRPKLPERIADIVDDLIMLDDNQLDMIRAAAHAAAEIKKGRDKAASE
jgi:hypothetical protein